MTSILFALALAAAATASPTHDMAGNRIEAFAETPPHGPEGAPPLNCTADHGWCAQISRDVDQNTSKLYVFAGTPTGQPAAAEFDLTSTDDDEFTLWTSIVRIAGPEPGVLVGVEHHVSTSYSGGGGGASQLELIRVRGEAAKSVLTAPVAGSLMIRACFGEHDYWMRRGACHDEYHFSGDVSLDPTTAVGPPRLVFEAKATAFPSGASRQKDSTTGSRLRPRDLVTAVDPACTYRRIFAFDAASDAYAPNAPLPDCSDYTVP